MSGNTSDYDEANSNDYILLDNLKYQDGDDCYKPNYQPTTLEREDKISEEDLTTEIKNQFDLKALIHSFFDIVTPPDTLLRGDGNVVSSFINALLLYHSYAAMLSGVSLL